jgi:hypothetical protein
MYCTSVEENPEINKFVLFTCWAPPGLSILNGKCMKRKDKLKKLVDTTGYFGPIMDVVIRGTIPHILVCHFAEDTKTITNTKSGYLKAFLHNHFKSSVLMETINYWMDLFIADYECGYRHKRSDLINSQINVFALNPRNLVSYLN